MHGPRERKFGADRRRDYRKRYPHTKDKGKREEEDVERRHIFGVGKT